MRKIFVLLVLMFLSVDTLADSKGNWLFDVSVKQADYYDENLLYLGALLEKETFKNISFGLSFFIAAEDNTRSSIDGNVFVKGYAGPTISYNNRIGGNFGYSLSILAGAGIGDVSSVELDDRSVCSCGLTIVEPMVKVSYDVSTQGQLALSLSSLNVTSESESFTTLGLSYRYRW